MKKILSFVLAAVFMLGFTNTAVMAEDVTSNNLLEQASQEMEEKAKLMGLVVGKEYEYKYPDGRIQKYYLDEMYNPYFTDENGEKVLLALPLEHTIITNEELLEVIQEGATFNTTNGNISSYAAPTNYHDLTNRYFANYNFSGEKLYQPMFKVPNNFPCIRVTTSNHVPATQGKINIVYTIYDTITGTSVASGMLRAVDCRAGKNIGGLTTASRFIGLTIGRSDELTSCNIEVIKYSNW